MTEFNPNLSAESQRDRWIKYGTNVAVASVVVIALAVLLVYLSQKFSRHVDTTASGVYSLKPQTVNLIGSNKQKIKIVSLYTRSKPQQDDQSAGSTGPTAADLDKQATTVDDLLDEYRSRGKNITVESIDPVKDPGKVDDLILETSSQESGQIDQYKKFADDVSKTYTSMGILVGEEAKKISELPRVPLTRDTRDRVYLAFFSIQKIDEIGKTGQDNYRKAMRERIPDYKKIATDVDTNMTELSTGLGRMTESFAKVATDNTVPAAYRQYIADNLKMYVSMKKMADDLLAREKALGELKLDTLKAALAQRNSILVRGETSWKVIPYEQVWHADARGSRRRSADPATDAPRFSGELAVTTAIIGLVEPVKPKLCFVRGGGPPVSSNGGVLTSVGDRLRTYNYDVTDKDLTGQYAAMAAQRQQQPVSEPGDAEIADAIWVVCGQPQQQDNPMAPPATIGQAVADHLAHGFHYVNGVKTPGGVALILPSVGGESFSDALQPLGISVNNGACLVHDSIPPTEGSENDFYNRARDEAPVFVVTNWGDHPITTPIESLPGVVLGATVVTSASVPGVVSTPLIPLPTDVPYWGETDLSSLESPKFDKGKDVAGPLYAAYAAEEARAGTRVVVIGSPESFFGLGDFGAGPVDMNDPILEQYKGVKRTAFPGDIEFFMNSIYWLGHRESMIAMSPSAMTVDRVGPISPAVLSFWHVGILLLGIPGLAVAIGAAVFFARRG